MQQQMQYPNQNPMFPNQQGQAMAQQGVNQQWGYGQQSTPQMMAQQSIPGVQQQGYYPQQINQQG